MTIRFDVPPTIEQALRGQGQDPSQVMKEAALIELYRQGTLTLHQLAGGLGLDRFQTEARLKQLNVYEGSLEPHELEADRQTLDRLFGSGR